MIKITSDLLSNELVVTTSRSGGPGGQNVNKVNSKVTLHFDIPNSMILSPEQKQILLEKLSSRLTQGGLLIISAQESRSQIQNKEAARKKLDILLEKAFARKKTRKPTKASASAKRERLKKKKGHSEKKKWRRKPGLDSAS